MNGTDGAGLGADRRDCGVGRRYAHDGRQNGALVSGPTGREATSGRAIRSDRRRRAHRVLDALLVTLLIVAAVGWTATAVGCGATYRYSYPRETGTLLYVEADADMSDGVSGGVVRTPLGEIELTCGPQLGSGGLGRPLDAYAVSGEAWQLAWGYDVGLHPSMVVRGKIVFHGMIGCAGEARSALWDWVGAALGGD